MFFRPDDCAVHCKSEYSGSPMLPANMIFVKAMKVGGSTFGGVLRRVRCVSESLYNNTFSILSDINSIAAIFYRRVFHFHANLQKNDS